LKYTGWTYSREEQMTFKIISDSSCDLDKKTLDNLDLEIFKINCVDEEGQDLSEDMSNKEI